jgi:3-methyladenine DNA glycosylase AlkC
MAEPFKNWINLSTIAQLADALQREHPKADPTTFTQSAALGLEALELKQRVRQVSDCLRRALPERWEDAAPVLLRMLPPPLQRDHDFAENVRVWPMTDVVAQYGLDHPALSLPLLAEMTRRWSSEFAIRPYIVRWPDETAAALDAWVQHPDLHVRRLVSEGTRPRLPWGQRLEAACRAPEAGLARIARLLSDPSPYVRRSVGNHLGDVCKDQPDLAVRTAAHWSLQGHAAIAKRGLRSLLKAGHPGALTLFGQGHPVEVLAVHIPKTAEINGTLPVTATLRTVEACEARVDLVWQWPGSKGTRSATFRSGGAQLSAGEVWRYAGALKLRRTSTRAVPAGTHALIVRVNGADHAAIEFEVTEPTRFSGAKFSQSP